ICSRIARGRPIFGHAGYWRAVVSAFLPNPQRSISRNLTEFEPPRGWQALGEAAPGAPARNLRSERPACGRFGVAAPYPSRTVIGMNIHGGLLLISVFDHVPRVDPTESPLWDRLRAPAKWKNSTWKSRNRLYFWPWRKSVSLSRKRRPLPQPSPRLCD